MDTPSRQAFKRGLGSYTGSSRELGPYISSAGAVPPMDVSHHQEGVNSSNWQARMVDIDYKNHLNSFLLYLVLPVYQYYLQATRYRNPTNHNTM